MRAFLICVMAMILSAAQVQAKSVAEYLPNFLRSTEGVFLSNCEAVFKERLRSPSTYSRKSYSIRKRSTTPIEAVELDYKTEADDREAMLRFEDDVEGYKNSLIGKVSELDLKFFTMLYEMKSRQYMECKAGKCPTRAIGFVKYEAANAYGTPVIGGFNCEVTYTDNLKAESSNNYRVDGLTELEYLMEALKN